MNFNDILEALLEGYEQGGHNDIDAYLKEKRQEMGLSKASLDKVEQASALIDRMDEGLQSLSDAKDKGYSVKRWLMDRLENALGSVSDCEAKQHLIDKLSENANTAFENQLKTMD